jgi:hypothetical protein
MDSWSCVGQVSRVALDAHIRWKVPFIRIRAKPVRRPHGQDRRMARTPARNRGLLPFRLFIFLFANIEVVLKDDSVNTIQDALTYISDLQPVELDDHDPSGPSAANQLVLIEELPPILVLHLKRFSYNEEAKGIVKISKPVQFAPELDIPLGTGFSFVSR